MARVQRRRVRRRLRPDVRRAELIDAALRVLRKNRGGASRVEDVTTAARAAKGTFYLYFPSWEDLLVALRDQILDDFGARLGARLREPGKVDWWTLLDELCEGFVDFVLELGGLHDAIFHGPIAQLRPIDDQRSATRRVSELLRAGIEGGAFTPVDIETAAPILFSVLHTTADSIAEGGDRDRFLQSMKGLLHRWLSP
jgi:AcrR family transcriptional regulator